MFDYNLRRKQPVYSEKVSLMNMHYVKMMIDRRINGVTPDGHPCHQLLPIPYDSPGLTVKIVQCSFLSEGAGCSIIRLTDTDGEYENSLHDYSNHTDIKGECSVIKISRNRYLATVMNNNCQLAQILSRSGCFLTSAIPADDNLIYWDVFAPNKRYISNLIETMKEYGYNVTRLSSTNYSEETVLTKRQEEVIRYAFDNGYYEVPKRITLDDLAERFDISKSTASVVIRDAEKKLITLCLQSNPRVSRE